MQAFVLILPSNLLPLRMLPDGDKISVPFSDLPSHFYILNSYSYLSIAFPNPTNLICHYPSKYAHTPDSYTLIHTHNYATIH